MIRDTRGKRELFCSLLLPSVSDQSNAVVLSQHKDLLMSKALEKQLSVSVQSVS